MLFVCGCSEYVGAIEFACPACKKGDPTAKVEFIGSDTFVGFRMKCTVCNTRSGTYKSFNHSHKNWPLVIFEEGME